jgi:phenylalanyl-tRNA synthetase alpha chain
MKEKIESLRSQIESAMETTATGTELYQLKLKFQAELKTIMGGMKDLPKEEKPAFGKIVNEFKQAMEEKFDLRAVVVREKEMQAKYEKERIDISMPGKNRKNCKKRQFAVIFTTRDSQNQFKIYF